MPPAPTADLVRVRVHAAALNRADILQRLGRYPAPPGVRSDIPGLEFAGEIEAVGEMVRDWKPGQRVFGITGGAAQAEYVTVPAFTLAEVPANLSWTEAAAVPEVFITAHDAVFTQAHLTMGESLLVHAAGSGVGTAAIQLARAHSARVFGTSRTAEKLEHAKSYGMNESVVVTDDPNVFSGLVKEWTGGRGVDVILDLVGAAYLDANLAALAPRGRLILVGTTSGFQATLNLSTVMSKRLRIIGTVLRARTAAEKALVTQRFVKEVVPLLSAGTVRPVIDTVFPLEQVREAHRRMETNQSFGKIVLSIQ